jgi:hypothetical protein
VLRMGWGRGFKSSDKVFGRERPRHARIYAEFRIFFHPRGRQSSYAQIRNHQDGRIRVGRRHRHDGNSTAAHALREWLAANDFAGAKQAWIAARVGFERSLNV